jgi:hypothetical protein
MLYRAAALTADHLGLRIRIESGSETVVGRIAQIGHRQVGNPPTDVETLLDLDLLDDSIIGPGG